MVKFKDTQILDITTPGLIAPNVGEGDNSENILAKFSAFCQGINSVSVRIKGWNTPSLAISHIKQEKNAYQERSGFSY